MRVLHLIPYMHPSAGGPPVVVDRWCVELRQLGIDAQVLTTDAYDDGSSPNWQREYEERFPIEVCRVRGPKGFGYSGRLKSSFVHRLQDVDLVHVHNLWSYSNQMAARYCRPAGVPFVVSTHGMLDPNSVGRKRWKKEIYGRLLEWPALRKATGLFFTHSEEERLANESCSGLPTGFVASLGIDPPPTKPRAELAEVFLKEFPQCREGLRIMLLSRLHSKKGLDLLIPAMSSVVRSRPEAKLILVGPGEPDYLAELKSLCSRHGIADNTQFTGPLGGDSKWGALAAADVFALPSYQENFAIALVEALGVGTPAVISDRINIWQDLTAAGAAVKCELNANAVADSILRVLESPENWQAMSIAGRKLAAEKYTWPNSANQVLNGYQQCLSREHSQEWGN